MINAGADVNIPDKDGVTPLQTAIGRAFKGDYRKIIEKLISAGADVNGLGTSLDDETPLQRAVEGGYNDIAEQLLLAGADVNAPTPWTGSTALQAAKLKGHSELVKKLKEAGAVERCFGCRQSQCKTSNQTQQKTRLLKMAVIFVENHLGRLNHGRTS